MTINEKIKDFGYTIKRNAGKIIVGTILATQAIIIGLQDYKITNMQETYRTENEQKDKILKNSLEKILTPLTASMLGKYKELNNTWAEYEKLNNTILKMEEGKYNWNSMSWNKNLLKDQKYINLKTERDSIISKYYKMCREEYHPIYSARQLALDMKSGLEN